MALKKIIFFISFKTVVLGIFINPSGLRILLKNICQLQFNVKNGNTLHQQLFQSILYHCPLFLILLISIQLSMLKHLG